GTRRAGRRARRPRVRPGAPALGIPGFRRWDAGLPATPQPRGGRKRPLRGPGGAEGRSPASPRRPAHLRGRHDAAARRSSGRDVEPHHDRAAPSRRSRRAGRGASRFPAGDRHPARQRRPLPEGHSRTRPHGDRLVRLRRAAPRRGGGVSPVKRLGDAIAVGFREWRTVALLLSANLLVAALMVVPSVPVLSGTFGHAPLAVGKPLVSTPLLGSLGPAFANGGTP